MSATEPIAADAGRIVLGIGGLAARRAAAGTLVTHALGSCLGIVVHDKYSQVGGMLHAQLPLGQLSPDRAKDSPSLFVDLGIALLFKAVIALGADKRKLRVVVAGGANMTGSIADQFDIANRNLTVMRKIFWQQGILVAGEDVGGGVPRTMTFDFASGSTQIESQGKRHTL
jgi:chemotaxis protein CheD